MASIDQRIADFWKWFSEHSAEFAAVTIGQELLSQLENRLFAIDRVDWEIGPGRRSACLFSLSPRGDPERLKLTRKIIGQAPQLHGWEFSPAKLERAWNLVFQISVNGKNIDVDGKLWEFVAYKFKDGRFDLDFRPDEASSLPQNEAHLAATIIIDGELGEERRMALVGDVGIVDSWDENVSRSARRLEVGLLAKVIA